MSIRVASWNVQRALDDDKRIPKIIEGVERLDTDTLVLPEAFSIEEKGIRNFAIHLGYTALSLSYSDKWVEYEDESPRDYKQHILVASRDQAANMSVVRLGTRNAIRFDIHDEGKVIQGVGAHFDDRSEQLRLGMAQAFIEQMDLKEPTVIVGDLNAMHDTDFKSNLLGNSLIGRAAHAIPEGKHRKFDRVKSLATRLVQMGDGRTMRCLIEAGLIEADLSYRSTMKFAGIPFGQMDHILHSDRVAADNFQVHKIKGSDHKAISADLRVRF